MATKDFAFAVGCTVISLALAVVWLSTSLRSMQYWNSRRAVDDMRAIGKYVETYKAAHHNYPVAAGMEELRRRLPARALIPRGPWGGEYVYVTTNDHQRYRLISEGNDAEIERRFLHITATLPPVRPTSSWGDDIVFQDGQVIQAHKQLAAYLHR